MKSLRNRLCLVTGAASGIGRATAELLVAEGARLCLTDINRPSLDAVTQELTEKGGRVLFHRALDVSDPYAVQAFAEAGGVDTADSPTWRFPWTVIAAEVPAD